MQAYAKIAGPDWTFFVTKTVINIGRSSEPTPQFPDGYNPDSDEDYIHIDLGPSKMVSRQHAEILYNTKVGKWFLHVKGRNGAKVNGTAWKQAQSTPLESGDVVEVGGNEMMFVLPVETSSLNVHEMYLQRAGISKAELPSPVQDPSRSGLRPAATAAPVSQSAPRSGAARGQQPIAPAPPDYKRPRDAAVGAEQPRGRLAEPVAAVPGRRHHAHERRRPGPQPRREPPHQAPV